MLSLLSTAEPYIRNQDPVVRKIGAERLRDATDCLGDLKHFRKFYLT